MLEETRSDLLPECKLTLGRGRSFCELRLTCSTMPSEQRVGTPPLLPTLVYPLGKQYLCCDNSLHNGYASIQHITVIFKLFVLYLFYILFKYSYVFV